MRESGGFSLIELLVASALGVLLLTIVGSFMISMIKTQSSVATSASGITAGQQVAATIGTAVRNSSKVSVTAVGSDSLLTVTTIDSSATGVWGCSDWYYSATDKTVRFRHSLASITAPVSTSAQRSWTLLASGVTQIPSVGAVVSPPTFSVASTTTGQALTLSFRTATGAASAATFSSTTSNVAGPIASVTC